MSIAPRQQIYNTKYPLGILVQFNGLIGGMPRSQGTKNSEMRLVVVSNGLKLQRGRHNVGRLQLTNFGIS